MDKQDQILNHIIDIKENMGAVNQHLKALNGKVRIHSEKIQSGDKRMGVFEKKLAYWGGAITAIIVIFESARFVI